MSGLEADVGGGAPLEAVGRPGSDVPDPVAAERVAAILERAGIEPGAWAVREVARDLLDRFPSLRGEYRPADVLASAHRVRQRSPKPAAVGAAVAAIVSARTGAAASYQVEAGEVLLLVGLPVAMRFSASREASAVVRVHLHPPAPLDAVLRSSPPDGLVPVVAALRAHGARPLCGVGDPSLLPLLEGVAALDAAMARVCALAASCIEAFVPGCANYLATLEDAQVDPIVAAVCARISTMSPWKSMRPDAGARLSKGLAHVFDRVVTGHAAQVAAARFKESVGLHDFVNLFPVARSLGRRLTLIVGPTNSGKTHEALSLVGAGASSVVLSPLRLLAMEHYETLRSRGLDCAMVTGEEVVGDPAAAHLAQTIETLDPSRTVDVAVVDEVQMLVDRSRGWAWSEAVIGVPARHVVMTGSPDCVELVSRIARMCGERLEVRTLPRKGRLSACPRPVGFSEVGPGDAVVAFSRAAVFEVREVLARRGLTSAVVYGALSPEVRRAEGRRFREGAADCLVATDAIGMGLNIGPLRRVLFSALSKYDGVAVRPLTDCEIRQIGGRAGRHGHHEEGFVGVLGDAGSPKRVASAIASKGSQLKRDRFLVRPSGSVVRLAMAQHPGDDIVSLVGRISALLADDPQVELCDMEETLEVAGLVKGSGLPVDVCWTYACSPVDARSHTAKRLLAAWSRDHAAGRTVRCPPSTGGDLPDLEEYGRIAMLYLWLARRFPSTYVAAAEADAWRRSNDALIEAGLASGAHARAVRREASRGAHGRGRGRR